MDGYIGNIGAEEQKGKEAMKQKARKQLQNKKYQCCIQ
jgi:fatty acid/phospholipid biosynthesis enzyme